MPRAPSSPKKPAPYKKRRRGFSRAGMLVETQIRQAGESRGFAVSRLLTHWSEIVGEDLAKLCRPLRTNYGRGSFGATLTVLASGAAAPIVQARLPELQERVNACYGYTAISRVKITQTAPEGFGEAAKTYRANPATRPEPAPRPIPALESVQDPELRAALAAMSARLPITPNK
ncbi:MAG: DUF721 domain-containing protein [Mangrovicoccus sp.]|nr:DUF721 domain-containing protein [Mangrovicoccus sp.]